MPDTSTNLTQTSIHPMPHVSSDTPFYKGNSMLRVFVPGDILKVEKIPFEDFQIGDVATFYPKGRNAMGIVHRIIQKTPDGYVTMGDNNPKPDAALVTPAQIPELVTARISLDGKEHPIPRGKAGMRQFRKNRLRRFLRRACSALLRPLTPLMFWRIPLKEARQTQDGTFYFRHGKLVARRLKNSSAVVFYPFYYKIFFRVPKTNGAPDSVGQASPTPSGVEAKNGASDSATSRH